MIGNLTKEKLGITTIRVSGKDRKRILSDVSKWISDNDGNINGIDLKTENGEFSVLVVVNGLSLEGEQAFRDKVAEDERFESWKVV